MNTKKWVYFFSKDKTEGSKGMRDLLGGKGANLAEMSQNNIPVPPGFTISTPACLDFYKTEKKIAEGIRDQVSSAIGEVEKITGKIFGCKSNPLLFSVRSGARVSMPGMMDTVLNLGLNDETVLSLAEKTGNARLAWDSYRRFIQMFSNVVLGINTAIMESSLEDLKEARGVNDDTELSADDLKDLVGVFKSILLQEHGIAFPHDVYEQLWQSVGAVFNSWNNTRAMRYRELNGFSHDWGTAVSVQTMVFGNMGSNSATGVCFTRDPSTGEKKFFGEYLVDAQGEDVVAGIRTPGPINYESKNRSNEGMKTLEESFPLAFKELTTYYQKLEGHYKDMQDIEFTIEQGRLYILQTRNGKRTAAAAIKIAVDLVDEGVISKEDAINRIDPEDLNKLLHPTLDTKVEKDILARGLPASPGAASGEIVFDSEMAQTKKDAGQKVILIRHETSPEDIGGMIAAEGILTARGGMTSHAAVVARGMGKPCVAGCSTLFVDYATKSLTVGGRKFQEGEYLTIDGAKGEVIAGTVPLVKAQISTDFSNFMGWVDGFRKLKVRANADNADDAEVAINFGAEGIGLCRTEHMFFDADRIPVVREMIFSESVEQRCLALDKLLPFQKNDFLKLFKVMHGKPVNIRLLDPPLHEFLPVSEEEKAEFAKYLAVELKYVNDRVQALSEFNPMLGHRGCRLGVTYPEIYIMQVRAIIEAALECKSQGIEVLPEIMIPLVGINKEFLILKEKAISECEKIFAERGAKVDYQIGTMIELPRAAITAGEMALDAAFFSFGTNDLTQTTFGLSRDDSGKFLGEYIHQGILEVDPFVSIDREGVGALIKMAVENGRKNNAKLHIGICGEHGGDPSSIEFCHQLKLDYVSCSPYRIPIARLAAAQASLKETNA